MTDLKEIIACVFGTLAFAVLLKVPKALLFYATFGGLISASISYILESTGKNAFITSLFAMTAVAVYSEILARIKKTPATVILLSSTIPLLPGSTIYHAMQNAVNGNTEQFDLYAAQTVQTATGLGLGAVIVAVLVKFISSQIEYYRS